MLRFEPTVKNLNILNPAWLTLIVGIVATVFTFLKFQHDNRPELKFGAMEFEFRNRLILQIVMQNVGKGTARKVSVSAALRFDGASILMREPPYETEAVFQNCPVTISFSFPAIKPDAVVEVHANVVYRGVFRKRYEYHEQRQYHGQLKQWMGSRIHIG